MAGVISTVALLSLLHLILASPVFFWIWSIDLPTAWARLILAAFFAARPPLDPDAWRWGAGGSVRAAFLWIPGFRYLVVDCTPSLRALLVRPQALLDLFDPLPEAVGSFTPSKA